ncbi:MAG: TonB-dependent receptor [Ignavibacteriales bacterium]|nr:TonB-dependent receptor [Ignavibacteriales bacterium]
MKNQNIRLFIIFAWILFGLTVQAQSGQGIMLKGKVVDSYSKEAVSAASVSVVESGKGMITDATGEFNLVLPVDKVVHINVSHLGYYDYTLEISARKDTLISLAVFLVPKNIELETVLVTGNHSHSKFEEISNLNGLVEGVDLQKNLGLTLASTLKNETGIAIRSMGPAPARPVFRGLGGDRILFTEDGARTSDLSATSPDHALTIEPFSITRADVIRGPRTLLFSPVTIGGVINIIRHDIPVEAHTGLSASAGSYYESANNGALIGANADYGFGSIVLKGSMTTRSTGDLYTPGGNLKNSYSNITGLGTGMSYIKPGGFAGYSYRSIDMEYGIPGGFVGAHPNGVRISVFRNVHSIKTSLNFNSLLLHNATLHVNRSFYRHKEFERADLIGAEFKILDYSGYLNFEHHLFGFNEDGIIGISGQYRDFEIGGFVFTPKSVSTNLALYFWQPFNYDRLSFEFGGRINRDVITPEREKQAKIGYIQERDFVTYSFAFSSIYEITKSLFGGLSLSRSSRVPTIEELFSEGPHLAAYSYETGNPKLSSEHGYGAELFAYLTTSGFYTIINLYYFQLSSFIIPRNTGEINYQTFLPVYSSQGVDAVIKGIEVQTEFTPVAGTTISAKIGFTQGNMDSGGALPQIPPAKLYLELQQQIWKGSTIDLGWELAAPQERVDNFETSTAGYGLLNFGFRQSFSIGQFTGLLSMGVDNILNIEYRNHLSRVKSVMPEAGRNLRTTLKIYFE